MTEENKEIEKQNMADDKKQKRVGLISNLALCSVFIFIFPF